MAIRNKLIIGALAFALMGCTQQDSFVQRLTAVQVVDSLATLSVTTGDTMTVYTLTVKGYGDYDRNSGWFFTGTLNDIYLLHGVYDGEYPPNYHDYLWLSYFTSEFYQLVSLSVSRSPSQNYLQVSIPFQVVPPSQHYTLRLWRMDENGERAYIFKVFSGSELTPL